MFCGNCGKEVTAGAKFCPNCGAAVSDQPAPAAEQPKTPAVERMSNPDGNGTKNSSQISKRKMGLPKPFIIVAAVLALFVALGVVLHLFGKDPESGSGNSTVPDWVEKIPYWPDEDGIPNMTAEEIPSTTYAELKTMWNPYFEGLGIPNNPDVEYHFEYYANRPDIFAFHQNKNICSVISYEPGTPNQPDLPPTIEPVIAKNGTDLYYLFYKRDSYYMILMTIPANPTTSYLTWPALGAIVVTDVKYSDLLNGTIDLEIVSIPGESGNNNGDLGIKDTGTEYSQYNGTWATAGRSWFDGGQILDIEVSGDSMTVKFSDIQAAPGCRVASVSQTVPVSDIKNGVIEIPFDNDGWGVSGTMILTFTDDAIICETTDIDMSDLCPPWSFSEMKYLLVRDDYAHEAMEIGPDAYEGLLPEEKVENEDDIPYVNAEMTILGQQFAPSDQYVLLGYDSINVRAHPVNPVDNVQYCWLGQRQYELYGVRDGIIVSYMDMVDGFPEVNTQLTAEFNGITPKTITTTNRKYHVWKVSNGYFVLSTADGGRDYLHDLVVGFAFFAEKEMCSLLVGD